ncbi:Hpt domain-containing protein [Nitrobacter sp.]|uniref:Hpt domain-containing protein n=1 Tax=unclassified Nitrobacter TaxID=2620411 RepID=UPI002D178438|nr:Hpt domain-containing protein [Nitrobacter sp.]
MSFFCGQVAWMPSPPLVPENGPIDFDHLHRMTLGDDGLEREVLTMFAGQAAELVVSLARLPPNAAMLAHRLKGSARAIGAIHVAAAASDLEIALRSGADPAEPRAMLDDAVSQACQAIRAILLRS